MTDRTNDVASRISAARLWVISEPARVTRNDDRPQPGGLPYLAAALYALKVVPTDEVASAAVDEGWRLYVKPEWVTSTDVDAIGRELIHLLWHLLDDHAGRARRWGVDAMTRNTWNLAADVAVTDLLHACRHRPAYLPSGKALGLPEASTTETAYELLLDRAADGADHRDCGSGAHGVSRVYELSPGTDGALDRFGAATLRGEVAVAFRAHDGGRGTAPAGLQRWIRRVTEPTTDWRAVLRGAVRAAVAHAAGRGDYCYLRPSRRRIADSRVIFPGQRRPTARLAVVIDTSSSVDDALLSRALGELDNLLASLSLDEAGVMVYSVDAAAHTAQRVRRSREVVLLGAGGTDMRVGLDAVAHESPRPAAVVVFTDGYTPWPDHAPPYTVVGCLLGRHRGELPTTPGWVVRVECLADA